MFERFTRRARQVVVHAQDEARALGHSYIGTEHLLLGLLREEEGLAAQVLEGLDVTIDEARARLLVLVGPGPGTPEGQIPFTKRAQRALEISLQEAFSLDDREVGTEHVLLALVRVGGPAVEILREFDLGPEQVKEAVARSREGGDGG
ncbi:MAG: Clp protease N-terminal domain-containing protein [Gaiellaceae bacterium]